MTTFDDREHAFENKFAHDEEMKFKAEAAQQASGAVGGRPDGQDRRPRPPPMPPRCQGRFRGGRPRGRRSQGRRRPRRARRRGADPRQDDRVAVVAKDQVMKEADARPAPRPGRCPAPRIVRGTRGAATPHRRSAMTNALSRMIATRDWLLADGATGTNLFNMGLARATRRRCGTRRIPTGSRGSTAAVDGGQRPFPDQFLRRQRRPAEAARRRAARAPSCRAWPPRWAATWPTGRTGRWSSPARSAPPARSWRRWAPDPRARGRDVPRTGRRSQGRRRRCRCGSRRSRRPRNTSAAAEAFALADMPWCGTMSFDTAGRTMMGLTSADMAEWSRRSTTRRWPSAPIAASAPRTCCAPCWVSSRRAPCGRSSPRAMPASRNTSTATSTMTARPS